MKNIKINNQQILSNRGTLWEAIQEFI
jgi:hypothetical protein